MLYGSHHLRDPFRICQFHALTPPPPRKKHTISVKLYKKHLLYIKLIAEIIEKLAPIVRKALNLWHKFGASLFSQFELVFRLLGHVLSGFY